MMPMTTQATQASTPSRRRKNIFTPDMDDGLGSSEWSLAKENRVKIMEVKAYFKVHYDMFQVVLVAGLQ